MLMNVLILKIRPRSAFFWQNEEKIWNNVTGTVKIEFINELIFDLNEKSELFVEIWKNA